MQVALHTNTAAVPMPAVQETIQNRSASTAWELAISLIYDKVVRHKLSKCWAGAEWWVQVAKLKRWKQQAAMLACACKMSVWNMLQVYEPGKGLAFHFDKDERVMKARHQMLQPVLSSVLYLTGHSMAERLGKLYKCIVYADHHSSQYLCYLPTHLTSSL